MHPLAGIHVEEVIEEAVLLIDAIQQEAQRGYDAGADLVRRQIAALMPDAQRCQAESGGRDTGSLAIVGSAIGKRAVAHQAGARAGFIPEK